MSIKLVRLFTRSNFDAELIIGSEIPTGKRTKDPMISNEISKSDAGNAPATKRVVPDRNRNNSPPTRRIKCPMTFQNQAGPPSKHR